MEKEKVDSLGEPWGYRGERNQISNGVKWSHKGTATAIASHSPAEMCDPIGLKPSDKTIEGVGRQTRHTNETFKQDLNED